jgi:3-oxoacyl-[acyl-carrier protein] reductase
MNLKGKVALITGAGRNIGRATALAMAEEGCNLVLITRQNLEGINKVAQEVANLGTSALALPADVTNAKAIKEVIQRAESEFGKVDILVNNAVKRIDARFLEMTHEQWDAVLNINLTGPFNCAKAVLPGMISRRWGRIINFSGIGGLWGFAGRAAISTVKSGIIGFTKSLAREFGEYNITVNAIAPGDIDVIRSPDDIKPFPTNELDQAAIKRMGRPEEVASLVAYLCTENAGYITGQVLSVNGGAYV